MKSWKRYLFLFHRWVGIVLCVFFALWFVSGIFMMYVEFPQLTRVERIAAEPPLDFTTATLTPAQAATQLRRKDFVTAGTPSRNEQLEVTHADAPIDALKSVHLSMLHGRPVYEIAIKGNAQPRVVFADTGEVLRAVSEADAQKAAAEFAFSSGVKAQVHYLDMIQTDQWTVSAALNDHRPLHHVALNDAAGTEYYVSSTTGAVVRDATRQERVLNYFAAVTHWLYPTFIRKYPDGWAWMVDILSGVGAVFAISGLWIGILRWRRKRPPGVRAVPYRGMMRWHYFTGAVFGFFLLTWVFSGLLSMNPAKLNPSRSPAKEQAQIFSGKAFSVDDFDAPAKVLPPNVIEAELLHYDSQPFYCVTMRDGSRNLIAASSTPARLPNAKKLTDDAAKLLPDATLASVQVLNSYDDYYYTRHPERGEKPLPVLRAQFADTDSTWFHIDMITGQVMERSTATNRVYRWLYNGLHSWDIRWLWERRPLWDITLITFLAGGLLLSVLGVVVGYRRLRN